MEYIERRVDMCFGCQQIKIALPGNTLLAIAAGITVLFGADLIPYIKF